MDGNTILFNGLMGHVVLHTTYDDTDRERARKGRIGRLMGFNPIGRFNDMVMGGNMSFGIYSGLSTEKALLQQHVLPNLWCYRFTDEGPGGDGFIRDVVVQNNVFYEPVDRVYEVGTQEIDDVRSIRDVVYVGEQSPTRENRGLQLRDLLEVDPRFVSTAAGYTEASPPTRVADAQIQLPDLRLRADSTLLGEGFALTETLQEGQGRRVEVGDVFFFQDGNDVTGGDWITVGQSLARVVGREPDGEGSSGALVLDRDLSWIAGEPVDLVRFEPGAPNIGSYVGPGEVGAD